MRSLLLPAFIALALAGGAYRQREAIHLESGIQNVVNFDCGTYDIAGALAPQREARYTYSFGNLPGWLKARGNSLAGTPPANEHGPWTVDVNYRSDEAKPHVGAARILISKAGEPANPSFSGSPSSVSRPATALPVSSVSTSTPTNTGSAAQPASRPGVPSTFQPASWLPAAQGPTYSPNAANWANAGTNGQNTWANTPAYPVIVTKTIRTVTTTTDPEPVVYSKASQPTSSDYKVLLPIVAPAKNTDTSKSVSAPKKQAVSCRTQQAAYNESVYDYSAYHSRWDNINSQIIEAQLALNKLKADADALSKKLSASEASKSHLLNDWNSCKAKQL